MSAMQFAFILLLVLKLCGLTDIDWLYIFIPLLFEFLITVVGVAYINVKVKAIKDEIAKSREEKK